ncbi:hypothetical protein B0H21DRAFT_710141 [Amylocystis lapponica]|nr:hypothetical protein B0H21DRAFT_710141 [Amylocystis lapponica]
MASASRQIANFALASQLIAKCQAYGVAAPAYTHVTEHEVRQISPTSTSSFNWWPYPSWGATATSTTPTAIATISSTALPATNVDAPISSANSVPISSPTASASLIRITALPPVSSSTSKRQHTVRSASFNIAYLAPLFAVLGAAAGALLTWCAWRWYRRRRERLAREGSLEPGPRYVSPPETGPEDLHGAEGASPPGWLARTFSASAGAAAAPGPAGGPTAYAAVAVDDDPFVDRAPSSRTRTSYSDGGASGQRSEHDSTSVHHSDSWDLLSDEGDAVPYDTLRHKSIRRGILERLKFGTLYRPPQPHRDEDREDKENESDVGGQGDRARLGAQCGNRPAHVRQDSDFRVDMLRPPVRAYSPASTPTRTRSLAQGTDDDRMSTPGFRIVEEDTEADERARHVSNGRGGASPVREPPASSWRTPWSSPTKQLAEDKFTALPTRRSIAEKRVSPFSTPAMASRTTTPISAIPQMTRVDSSILPLSPPRITSPPLESQLFFGPIGTDFGSTPSLDLRMPGEPGGPLGEGSPEAGVKARNKLRTQREPPLLPFPSSSDTSPYRNRLKKPAANDTSAADLDGDVRPAPPVSRSPSCSGISGRLSAAERYHARQSVHDKVEEILSHSWSQRDMSSESLVGSTTRFGALVHDSPAGGGGGDGATGTSIHQRLAALE